MDGCFVLPLQSGYPRNRSRLAISAISVWGYSSENTISDFCCNWRTRFERRIIDHLRHSLRHIGNQKETGMAKGWRSLFEIGEDTSQPNAGNLLLVSRPDRPLTAAQREFNKLVIKVEELRERLRKEARRFDDDGYHEHAHTLPVD